MNYAFMSSSCPDLTLQQMLDLARDLGYAAVEPRVEWDHRHGIEAQASDEDRRRIRELIAGSGVAVCCVATGCRYADPAEADKHLTDTHTYIDLAADIGCTRLRVFGGPLPEDMPRDRAIQQVADSLRSAADHAQQRGVTLCFETHDAWTAPQHVAEVVQRVNHPAIAVNWDIMHPILFGQSTMDAAFETLQPWIRHVHVHDGVLEEGKLILKPIGEGAIDHRRALALLTAMIYDGYLSGEWINWQPALDHLPRELAALKGYEQASG